MAWLRHHQVIEFIIKVLLYQYRLPYSGHVFLNFMTKHVDVIVKFAWPSIVHLSSLLIFSHLIAPIAINTETNVTQNGTVVLMVNFFVKVENGCLFPLVIIVAVDHKVLQVINVQNSFASPCVVFLGMRLKRCQIGRPCFYALLPIWRKAWECHIENIAFNSLNFCLAPALGFTTFVVSKYLEIDIIANL